VSGWEGSQSIDRWTVGRFGQHCFGFSFNTETSAFKVHGETGAADLVGTTQCGAHVRETTAAQLQLHIALTIDRQAQ